MWPPVLLFAGKTDDAIQVFRLNVEEYPKAWNPYDSLGEAYMKARQEGPRNPELHQVRRAGPQKSERHQHAEEAEGAEIGRFAYRRVRRLTHHSCHPDRGL